MRIPLPGLVLIPGRREEPSSGEDFGYSAIGFLSDNGK